jgi:hypothetical protein
MTPIKWIFPVGPHPAPNVGLAIGHLLPLPRAKDNFTGGLGIKTKAEKLKRLKAGKLKK